MSEKTRNILENCKKAVQILEAEERQKDGKARGLRERSIESIIRAQEQGKKYKL